MARYKEQPAISDDGWTEWVQPVRRGYKMACCDCGLVHLMDVRVFRGRVQFRMKRHRRATATMRAWKERRRSAREQVADRALTDEHARKGLFVTPAA